jgi:hypothetical protein
MNAAPWLIANPIAPRHSDCKGDFHELPMMTNHVTHKSAERPVRRDIAPA